MGDVVVVGELVGEVWAEQDLVQYLRVAFEHIRIALCWRQVLDERVKHAARFEDVHRLGELEVVDVAEDDHVRVRVGGEEICDKAVNDLRLSVASDLAEASRGLRGTEERLVVALRAEVVDDDEQLLLADAELADK